jgi:hypothetical protein
MELLLRWRCRDCADLVTSLCSLCNGHGYNERWVGLSQLPVFKSEVTKEFVIISRRLENECRTLKKEFREFSRHCDVVLSVLEDPEFILSDSERELLQNCLTRLHTRLLIADPKHSADRKLIEGTGL